MMYFRLAFLRKIYEIRPIPGGAVMYYNLPSDLDLMAIRVRYKDAFGQEIMREGSYASDSLSFYMVSMRDVKV